MGGGMRSLLELAGRQVKSKAVLDTRDALTTRKRWVILPAVPVSPSKRTGLLDIMRQPKQVSAIAWLKQCCPQISQNDAETLFRSCQVRIFEAGSKAEGLEDAELRKVTRRELLPEGSTLALPKRSLESLNIRCRGRELNRLPEGSPSIFEKDGTSESMESGSDV